MKNILVKKNISIRKAMKTLSKEGQKCLVIHDGSDKLIGTLSDGDIRKAILRGLPMDETIKSVYQKSPTYLIHGDYTVEDARDLFLKNNFDLIPVINNKKQIVKILFLETILNNKNKKIKKLNVPVVIMAGGKGTRMEPFTKILPKPLIPINDKPIIEHIIDRFTEIGCDNFSLTINYKSRILKAYFEELQPDYEIDFIKEENPLGTGGSLHFFKESFSIPFFVTNCDIIIKIDYKSLYNFHEEGGFDISLVASAKEYVIPYGTCKLNKDGSLSHISEKPSYDFLINSGLYVLSPNVLKLVPENCFFHITDLIQKVIETGGKVGVFPIDDDQWLDVGQWAEYQNALEKL